MHIQRLGPVGQEIPVATVDGVAYDLRPITDDITGAFFASNGIARVREAIAAGRLERSSYEGQRIGPPIARPHALWCIGMNYAAHAREAGLTKVDHPVVFHKTTNTIIGPNDTVRIPRGSHKTDWEVELAVVIGQRAQYLNSPADAAAHIAGFTMSNDVSERAFQNEISGGQWSKGKCCETFNPLGPAIVPSDEIDGSNLRLRSWVNGEPRQDSNTADMIFDVAFLVWHLSQFTVLEPGDVVNTGTPEGVALSGRYPYLRAGDVITLEIEGIGTARQVCSDATPAETPAGSAVA